MCDGVTRREALRVGGLSLLGGLTLPQYAACARGPARARSVILINLLGGPSHIDMFDMKPDAPAEIRGEFKPIATSLSGLQICEHMPRIARTMHLSSLVRTVTHNYDSHNPLGVLTGFTGGDPRSVNISPDDPPSMGAVCQYFGMGGKDAPAHAVLPCYPGEHEGIRRPGPYGGFLGRRFDPLFSLCEPTFARQPSRPHYDPVRPLGVPRLPGLEAHPALTLDRLSRRRSILQQVDAGIGRFDRSAEMIGLDSWQQRAFDILTSGRVRDAFDLERETPATRERYGLNLYGASVLAARRLIEAGVVFVTVNWEIFGQNGHSYDTHENNFNMLKNENLPILDQAYPALLQDLEDRGLLQETIVVVMGEMGRSPKVNPAAGRDHWPQCGFSLLAGGGIRRGTVHGRSDSIGAYPEEDPVKPGDLVATLYQLLGLDPEATVPDRSGRPIFISHGGAPIRQILA